MVLSVTFACKTENSSTELSIRHFQIPVLKGLTDNPVIRVNLKSAESAENEITLFELDLQETDQLSDLKSVRIWSTDLDSTWIPGAEKTLFAETGNPDSKIKIMGIQKLNPGDNFFWITLELKDHAGLHNKTGIRISKVEFGDHTFIQPEIDDKTVKQRIGVAVRKHMDDNVHTHRIPGLTTTNEGTLLAVYDARRLSSRDLQGDIDIGVSRSTDGGNTWEPMRIGLDMGEWGSLPQKFNGVSDACILVDKNSGKIFLAGLWMYGVINDDGKWLEGLTEDSTAWNHQWRTKGSQPGFGVKQTSQFMVSVSEDDGKTWGPPVNLTTMCKKEEWWLWAPAPGHGITLDDGTLVFPTQGRDKDGETFSNITWSKDGGQTWTTSNPAFSNTTENMVVQLSDKSIMLNARYNPNRNNPGDDNGRVVVTTSDLGETWQEHPSSRSALIESTCMASIHKHEYSENGQEKSLLLFSNPNTKSGRHHMTLKVSFDDGNTWPEEYWLLLDEGKSRGYSCITSVDEQTIGILYEGSTADMVFESIPIRELLDSLSNKEK